MDGPTPKLHVCELGEEIATGLGTHAGVLFWSEDVDPREGMSVGKELRFGFCFPCLSVEFL